MKLSDLVKVLPNTDDDQVTFIEHRDNFNSDILLVNEEDSETVYLRNGKTYHYLLEVSIAKEFVEDWTATEGRGKSDAEIAKRLYLYAVHDA